MHYTYNYRLENISVVCYLKERVCWCVGVCGVDLKIQKETKNLKRTAAGAFEAQDIVKEAYC